MFKFFARIGLAALLAALCCQCGQPRYDNPDEKPDGKEPDQQEITTPVDSLFQITLKDEDCNFADWAEYGVYVPTGKQRIKAILILQHGCGMEQFGLTRHYDLQYQAFARKWDLAVIETAIHDLAGYGPGSVLLYSTLPNCEWKRVEGRGFSKKVADIAREVAEEECGELYITKPGLYHVEIYRVESI